MYMKAKHYRNWFIFAPLGLATAGFGLCLVAEAATLKASGAGWLEWVPFGTVALVVFNTGLSFFGRAVLERIRYERAG